MVLELRNIILINKLFWHTLNITVTTNHSYMHRRQNVSNWLITFCKRSHLNRNETVVNSADHGFRFFRTTYLKDCRQRRLRRKSLSQELLSLFCWKTKTVHDTHIWNKRIILKIITEIPKAESICIHGNEWSFKKLINFLSMCNITYIGNKFLKICIIN